MNSLVLLVFLSAISLSVAVFCPEFVEPFTGTVGYNAYRYTFNVAGTDCIDADLVCQATVDVERLRGRTWFLTNNVEFHGTTYPDRFVQQFNVACPAGHYLHLYPQRLATEGISTAITSCELADSVTVRNPEIGFNGSETFCGEQDALEETELFNGGLGRIVTNGNASVDFCTNRNMDFGLNATGRQPLLQPFNGFAVRATCVDPKQLQLNNCVDYQFYYVWDRDFFDALANADFEKPQVASIPHKRSVKDVDFKQLARKHHARDKRMDRRFKRFVQAQTFTFGPQDSVTYEDGRFVFTFNNGTDPFRPPFFYFCVEATSDFLGSRRFYLRSPFVFNGPGSLFIDQGKGFNVARLTYTVDETNPSQVQSLLLPGALEMATVNRIYDYIFDCFVDPLPVVLDDMRGNRFPLPDASKDLPFSTRSDIRLKSSNLLNFVQGDISDNVECLRRFRIRRAPSLTSRIDPMLFRFCQWMWNSCSPIIAAACRELVNLDEFRPS